MRVRDDHRVYRVHGHEFGSAQVRRRAVFARHGHAAVYHYLALSGSQQGAAPSDLPEPAQRGHPQPGLFVQARTHQPLTDLSQELLPVVLVLPEILPYLRDGLRRDWRGSHDLGRPAYLLFDLVQDDAVLADDKPGRDRLDGDLSGVVVEVDVIYLRLFGNDLPDLLLRALRARQHGRVRPYGDPPAQVLRELADQVVVVRKLFEVLGVYYNVWPLEVNIRYLYVGGDDLLHGLSGLVKDFLYAHLVHSTQSNTCRQKRLVFWIMY